MTDINTLFQEAWNDEVAKRQERSPSFTPDEYTVTGRAPASYGGKKNAAWWADNGPVMVQRWIDWRQKTNWAIWEAPSGEPGIEIGCNFTLPGDIAVVAYIDRVFVLPTGELCVLDLKSGRLPETAEQLGLYATALEVVFGERPKWGYFWSGEKGEHSQPYDLDRYTGDYFAKLFEQAITGINAGVFLPKPANNCSAWCGVSRFCRATDGPEAFGHDPLTIATEGASK